jgi:hypothetical protein
MNTYNGFTESEERIAERKARILATMVTPSSQARSRRGLVEFLSYVDTAEAPTLTSVKVEPTATTASKQPARDVLDVLYKVALIAAAGTFALEVLKAAGVIRW